LPRAEDVPLPTAEELLYGPRRDWIILRDGRLLVVEPVYPRPETIKKIQAERDAILADPKRRYSPEGKERLNELNRMDLFVPEGKTSAEYQIRLDTIEEIVHHEDLMLRRADRLIAEGDTRKAFELMFVVARTDPNWPGLDERQVRLTAADAARLLDAKDGERALALVESLYERKEVPPEARDLLDRSAAVLIGGAIEAEDYRRARFDLARLRGIDAQRPALAAWADRLVERAKSLRAEAERASAAGDDAGAVALVEKAARAWPKLDGLRPLHARLSGRYQRLLVGVPGIASAAPLAIPTPADDRTGRLTTGDLFEIDGFETVPSYRSVYFERWEPTDLGRRARFTLRPALPGWASRPPLTAPQVIELLARRTRRGDPAFDAGFADLVREFRPLGPFEFEAVFSRIPLRAESALTRPPVFAGAGPPVAEVFRRFAEAERSGGRVVYRRTAPERSDDRHLTEVVEVAYPSYEDAARAFDRGDVRMLADVPPWDVPRLRDDKRFSLTKLALPATHLVQFHPASKPLKSTELRRALAAAADARDLLRIVAGEGGETLGRPVTAPYPSTHLGYDRLVEPRAHDLPLALALTLAAEKRFGGRLPELVFAAPAEAPARHAAESLASSWKRIGLPVRLVTFDDLGPSGRWDIAYRQLSVADPAAALAPLITLDPAGDVTALCDLPEWLRQRLLDLGRAGDAATAQAILIDLHRLLYADVLILPLFEVDRFVATRGAIRGLPGRPVAVYQAAERWVVPPDYPEETP
jgi:hypothetical protein